VINLNEDAKKAVQNLSDAINSAVERSADVQQAIKNLHKIGYEPVLSLKLEVILQETAPNFRGDFEEPELNLTEEDVRTLQRMKIRC
jgi:hypothetical protein